MGSEEHIWKKLDELEKAHNKAMSAVTDSLNDLNKTVGDLSRVVVTMGVHSHDPLSCARMAMHEEGHKSSGVSLRNVLTGLTVVAILSAAATIILRALL